MVEHELPVYEITEMEYTASGEILPATYKVIRVDPTLEWDVRCMCYLLLVQECYAFRWPIEGEVGSIGNRRIVVSGPPNITYMGTLRREIYGA